jgi:plasmid stability protein
MSMVQVRNVPDDVHRRLKSRAAMQGRSLSEMLLQELVHLVDTPSLAEIEARLATLPPVEIPGGAADIISQERTAR